MIAALKILDEKNVPREYAILHYEGYWARVCEIIDTVPGINLHQVYHLVEQELQRFHLCRYSSYLSFRLQYYRYIKQDTTAIRNSRLTLIEDHQPLPDYSILHYKGYWSRVDRLVYDQGMDITNAYHTIETELAQYGLSRYSNELTFKRKYQKYVRDKIGKH